MYLYIYLILSLYMHILYKYICSYRPHLKFKLWPIDMYHPQQQHTPAPAEMPGWNGQSKLTTGFLIDALMSRVMKHLSTKNQSWCWEIVNLSASPRWELDRNAGKKWQTMLDICWHWWLHIIFTKKYPVSNLINSPTRGNNEKPNHWNHPPHRKQICPSRSLPPLHPTGFSGQFFFKPC